MRLLINKIDKEAITKKLEKEIYFKQNNENTIKFKNNCLVLTYWKILGISIFRPNQRNIRAQRIGEDNY